MPDAMTPDPAREAALRCRYCGLTGYPESFGGPDVCPTCDTGAFDPSRLAQTVDRLLAQLDAARARVRALEGLVVEVIDDAVAFGMGMVAEEMGRSMRLREDGLQAAARLVALRPAEVSAEYKRRVLVEADKSDLARALAAPPAAAGRVGG